MNLDNTLAYAALSAALAMAIPALAQNSSEKDLADRASSTEDAARERNEQAVSPEAVKAIFAKAENAASRGAINFCGFYLSMSEDDARTLAAYYGLEDDQWQVFATPTTKEVCQLSLPLHSIRRITKGGNTFDELLEAVANRIGKMELKRYGSFVPIPNVPVDVYECANRRGLEGRMSEKNGLVLVDAKLMRKAREEATEVPGTAVVEAAKKAVAKLASDMVPIPGRDYAMCKYEVTQSLWFAVMGENPSQFKGADLPVGHVTRYDCQKFLKKLNALPEVKASGRAYRIPTGDEWTHACLAGAKGHYCRLADGMVITTNTLDEVAWFKDNSGGRTHPVGQKKPNAFGLYDMHGNVWEWTVTGSGAGNWIPRGGRCYDDIFAACATIPVFFFGDAEEKIQAGFRLVSTKAMDGSDKSALAKLASDMVSIPGEDYAMCKYEVTEALWFAVMGEPPLGSKGADLPVENVSWYDCRKFLEKLNALPEVKASGRTYRLPTADEWEKADCWKLADGTAITKDRLDEVAWIRDNNDSGGRAHPVGQKKPNAFGLYDMHGNVEEWTSTAGNGPYRISCGGSWRSSSWENSRRLTSPSRESLGFRLASDKMITEAERKAAVKSAGAERKAMEVMAKDAVAKLASDMIPIPGKDYAMCKYEVTQSLWFAVMGEPPSRFKGADLPVERVSWYDCRKFLEKLNALPEVKASGRAYRLPTRDEWEHACRAGATGRYCKLADGTEITKTTLDEVAWFKDNSGGRTHPVGQKKPNAFGLYDLYGNVSEWTATATGILDEREVCGGCWNRLADYYEAHRQESDYHCDLLGFRLVSVKAMKGTADKAMEGRVTAKDAVAKLASDMVPIPGRDYAMCKYEVTQALWFAIMGEPPSRFKGADLPVERVSWDECQEFLEKLNALPEVKASGRAYRLPTKDEWKHACLAGAEGKYCKLANGTEITQKTFGNVAWFKDNSGNRTHPVGQKTPNAFGLYDMLGNVSEWTATATGSGAGVHNDLRVCCGGNWTDGAAYYNSDKAYGQTEYFPDFRGHGFFGFRLVSAKAMDGSDKSALPEVKASGRAYRLPMADEWMYACLAGAKGAYCKLAD